MLGLLAVRTQILHNKDREVCFFVIGHFRFERADKLPQMKEFFFNKILFVNFLVFAFSYY